MARALLPVSGQLGGARLCSAKRATWVWATRGTGRAGGRDGAGESWLAGADWAGLSLGWWVCSRCMLVRVRLEAVERGLMVAILTLRVYQAAPSWSPSLLPCDSVAPALGRSLLPMLAPAARTCPRLSRRFRPSTPRLHPTTRCRRHRRAVLESITTVRRPLLLQHSGQPRCLRQFSP